MTINRDRLWHWLPRILAIGGIFFLAIFALDVFSEYDNALEIAIGLFMHLIPSYILFAVTVLAWRYGVAGGLLFIGLGLLSIVFFETYRDLIVMLLVSVPPIIVGILFIYDEMRPQMLNQSTA